MEYDFTKTDQPCTIDSVTRSFLDFITDRYNWFGINMDVYEVEIVEHNEGFGRITWLHKENNKTLRYAERRLQCTGFFYDEATGEVLQYNNPLLT